MDKAGKNNQSTDNNQSNTGDRLSRAAQHIEQCSQELEKIPQAALSDAFNWSVRACHEVENTVGTACANLKSTCDAVGKATGKFGQELYKENERELKPIAEAIGSIPESVDRFRKDRPITSLMLGSMMLGLPGLPRLILTNGESKDSTNSTSKDSKTSADKDSTENTSKSENKGTEEKTSKSDDHNKKTSEKPTSTSDAELTVKSGDGYWNLAARTLGLENKQFSDAENRKLLAMMKELEDRNGHKRLYAGQHILIPQS